MKKKKRIWIFSLLALVVAAALSAGVVTQLVRPVSVKQVCVWIEPFYENDLRAQRASYNRIKENSDGKEQIILESDAFPSNNPEDYCHVRIFPIFKSHSVLHAFVDDGLIQNPEQATGVIFKRSLFGPTKVDRFSETLSGDAYGLMVQRQGRTDEEILKMVQGLDMDVFFENDLLHSQKMKLPLKKAELLPREKMGEIQEQYYGSDESLE